MESNEVTTDLLGEPIHHSWLVAHYPPYWHYDVLQVLLILSRMGKVVDPRTAEGIDLLLGLRRNDGLWHKGPSWWRAPVRGANRSSS